MRKSGLVLGAAAAVLSITAAAAAPLDRQVAPAIYAGFDFGGAPAREEASSLRYGFQLNYGTLRSDMPTSRLMEVNLNQSGLASARFAGIELGGSLGILNEDGENKSIGDQIGSVFKGIGVGAGTVLVAGGLAVAVIVASAGGGDDEGAVVNGPGGGSASDRNYCIGEIPPTIGNGCIISGFAETADAGVESAVDRARMQWLESHNGQMGDLLPR